MDLLTLLLDMGAAEATSAVAVVLAALPRVRPAAEVACI